MRRVLIPATVAPIGPGGAPAGPVLTLAGRTMGTTWSVRCAGAGGEGASLRSAIEAELARLVAELSHWEPASALCRFNRAEPGSRHVLPDALFTVLDAACAIARDTGGACDPTLGALVDLWGFGPPGPVAAPPAPDSLAAARAAAGWERLALDREGRSALQPGGLSLDLSAIAKGYAVDRVSELLSGRGLVHHLVEIGGELRGRGLKPGREPWWVALEGGEGTGGPGTVVALHDLAVAGSGEYRRFFEHGGRRYGHSLDPRTGRPVPGDLVAVSVLHASCMMADGLATALMALGPEAGPGHAGRHRIAARFLTREEGRLVERFSPAAEAMLA
ncbi:thiamine biosynthesis lipoprotein [Methylobacterium sp. BE186]|uniref:FAD:protein FMN transferase n=1 Tax=Methylobacterium sp. BE186 TaxID=2817715 RepID=UPI00285B4455|nr:FAD:protein FMN transferase [Methylobacterium sp. BE186]MDR7035916.1 thiamine biosynthesis lipoprotein [Methylobacterium sp. BE186]